METEREVHRARRWRSTLKVGDGASAPTAPRCEAGPLRAASERAAEGGGVLKRLVGGVAVGAGAVVVAERAVPTCGEQVGPKEHDGRGAAEPGAPTRSERARAAGVGAEARSPARVREPRAATSLDRVAVPGDEVLKVGAEDGERSDPVKRGRARWEQHRVCGAVARGVSKGRGGLSRAAVRRHRRRGLHPNHAVGVARADADGVGRRVVDPGGLGGVAAGVVRKSRAGLHGSPRDAVLRDGGALPVEKGKGGVAPGFDHFVVAGPRDGGVRALLPERARALPGRVDAAQAAVSAAREASSRIERAGARVGRQDVRGNPKVGRVGEKGRLAQQVARIVVFEQVDLVRSLTHPEHLGVDEARRRRPDHEGVGRADGDPVGRPWLQPPQRHRRLPAIDGGGPGERPAKRRTN
eukprot:m.83293 g.83293  ORF g.83293 m.83293 type:complete len:410 (-) comp11184_c0_seq3:714-1943(-)